jgi:hypothetical protein
MVYCTGINESGITEEVTVGNFLLKQNLQYVIRVHQISSSIAHNS